MCSFLRMPSRKGLGPSKRLGAPLQPGTAYPSEMSALGPGMAVSGRKSPLSMEVELAPEGKNDLEERRVITGTTSPTELGLRVGLGKDFPCSKTYEERMASPEIRSPSSKGLELRLRRQNISRTFTDGSNLGDNRISASQETKPPLGALPGRVGLEKERFLAGYCPGRVTQPPLGRVCGSPQASGGRRCPVNGDPEGFGASVGKLPALGMEGRGELGGEPTCVVMKPSAEMEPPVEVDMGLTRPGELAETEPPEPQMGLVIEPSECQLDQQPEEQREAENAEPGLEPPDRIRPIYSGKFFDRMPCWPSAGKVLPIGYRVATCLTEKFPRLMTPPEAKKFFNFRYPPAGAERVFYGRANDPQIEPSLTHGIRSKTSIPAKVLINPQPITTFQQKMKDKKESVYFSNRRAPLGKSHDQTPGLPKGLDLLNTTFGTAIVREMSARDMVNPPKPYKEVFEAAQAGHDLYIVSHNDYFVGEAKNRKYNPSSFHRFNLYGIPTPHFNDGRNMKKTLHWLHELQIGEESENESHSVVSDSLQPHGLYSPWNSPGQNTGAGIEPAYKRRRRKKYGLDPWIRKIPWRKPWQPTPAFLPGESHGRRNQRATVHGVTKSQTQLKKRGAKIVSKRVDDFKEKFQHRLGRVLDPIAETMNVPPDHTFGACLRPEDYGVGDLIHRRLPGEYLRGKDRQRALVAAVRHHLKKVNYQNFDTLLAAFRHYDKKGDGVIDKAELQEACDQASLHLDEKLLDQLFEYCDVDNDGLINYLEFANFLTWKDKTPLKEYEERVLIKGRKPDCANPDEANVEESEPALLLKPEDIVLKEPGSSEKTLRTLLRPSDKVSNHYKTTSSEISAVVGAVPSTCYPTYGVPTIRSDIPAPQIRRVSDRTSYGEEGNAYSLLHPTIFAQKGVFERDFFKTRSKQEISEILCNIGVKLSEDEFENVWNLASKKHHRGEVCVESIRNVLDELKHADRTKCKTAT